MFELRRCRAPKANHPSTTCDKEFMAYATNAFYCSRTCRNRANKHAKLNRLRGLGYGTGAGMQSTNKAEDIQAVAEALERRVQSGTTTSAEVERALAIQKLIEVDSEAELLALGYSANKKAERWSDAPSAQVKPDTSAEPKLSTPKSDEENPPQFINEEYEPNPDDPYADYVPPDSGEL
jgi:hypothetical protein